jgi:hypothetical protein
MKFIRRFAQAMQAAMKQQGIASIKEVADGCDLKYETIRRAVVGDALPSRLVFDRLCDFLKLNKTELTKLWLQDRVEHQYGKASAALSGRNPELQPIEVVWPHISDQHKRDLVAIAKMFANHDHVSTRRAS